MRDLGIHSTGFSLEGPLLSEGLSSCQEALSAINCSPSCPFKSRGKNGALLLPALGILHYSYPCGFTLLCELLNSSQSILI